MSSHAVEKISATEPAEEFCLENFSQFLLWTLKSPRKNIYFKRGKFLQDTAMAIEQIIKKCLVSRVFGGQIYYAEKFNRVAYRDFDP